MLKYQTRLRHAQRITENALKSFRVVVLNGPRQSGKTTLAGELARSFNATIVSLDDASYFEACQTDPAAFLSAFKRPLFIDEFQRAGDKLVRAVKMIVDSDRSPGQFLLTGSSRFLTTAGLSESLAGRAAIIDLWPYSQGEVEQLGPDADSLLRRLFDPEANLNQTNRKYLSRNEYLQIICRGGFPEIQDLTDEAKDIWFDSYVATIIERDVPLIARGRHLSELPRLLRVIASRTSQEMNVVSVGASTGIDRSTLSRNYLPLLESIYLIRQLPSWSRNITARAVKHPKIHFTDSGLAASILGIDPTGLLLPNAPLLGPLVETFVIDELVRQVSFASGSRPTLYHFRSPDGPQIDVIAEAPDGKVVAIEVKSSTFVDRSDFKHLSFLRDKMDKVSQPFVKGVVIYLGDKVLPFGDRLIALPLCHIWQSE
ncbi:MAG: ATP-binding protein [Acidimicrobiales bacterium]|nr:ATP-binding protein [Acidimicrobiales bacterium]